MTIRTGTDAYGHHSHLFRPTRMPGPVWQGGDHRKDELLASCYTRAIGLCRDHELTSVAFPAISTGVYRFPAERAAGIAVSTTVEALKTAPTLRRVIFCCFSKESAVLHEQVLTGFGKPCAD